MYGRQGIKVIFGLVIGALYLGTAIFSEKILQYRNRSRIAPYPYPLEIVRTTRRREIERPRLESRDPFYRALEAASLGSQYILLARVTRDMSYYDLAEEAAKHSLVAQPKRNSAARLVLAQVAQARHQFTRAIEIAESLLGESSSEEVISLLVTANLGAKSLNRAETYADQLVKGRPIFANYLLHALVMEAQGKDDLVLNDFRSALSVEDLDGLDDSVWLRTVMGRFFLRRNRLDDARDVLKEAIRLKPSDAMALSLMAEVEGALERFPRAIELAQDAFRSSHELKFLVQELRLRKSAGQVEEARHLSGQIETLIATASKTDPYFHSDDWKSYNEIKGAL